MSLITKVVKQIILVVNEILDIKQNGEMIATYLDTWIKSNMDTGEILSGGYSGTSVEYAVHPLKLRLWQLTENVYGNVENNFWLVEKIWPWKQVEAWYIPTGGKPLNQFWRLALLGKEKCQVLDILPISQLREPHFTGGC